MGVPGSAVRSRHDLQKRLNEARNRTDEVFQIVREEAMYDRPINERHRIIFYVGHVEAFDWNLLAQRAFGLRSFHETFDKLFAFGIDPVGGGLPTDKPSDWPSREEIDRYNGHLRSELDRAIGRVLAEPSAGHPLVLQMLEVAIEHRLMHAETLAYMLHQLPADRKIPAKDEVVWRTPRAKSHLVEVQSGHATLGMQREQGDEFGWDNEFEAQEVFVPEFAIDNYNVKNRDFLLFMQAGGYTDKTLWDAEGWAWHQQSGTNHPTFWRRNGSLWMYRTCSETFSCRWIGPCTSVTRKPRLTRSGWGGSYPPKNSSIVRLTGLRKSTSSARTHGAMNRPTSVTAISISHTGIQARWARIHGAPAHLAFMTS